MFVSCRHTRANVHDEDDSVGKLNGYFSLFGNARSNALRVDVPTAGVDERDLTARPLRGIAHAVAGDSRDVFYNSLAATENAVDERRLAHVRAADNGQHGRWAVVYVVIVKARTVGVEQVRVFVFEVIFLQAGQQRFGPLLRVVIADFADPAGEIIVVGSGVLLSHALPPPGRGPPARKLRSRCPKCRVCARRLPR